MNNRVKLVEEGIIHKILDGDNIQEEINNLFTENKISNNEIIKDEINSVEYSIDDINTKRLYYYNLFKDYRPDPFFEFEMMIPKSIGCENGCLYCPFCMASNREDIKTNIVQEMKNAVKKTGGRYYYIVQNDICRNEESINKFCDSIIEEKLDILWTSPVEGKRFLSKDLFIKMKRAGCKKLFFGVDTGSEKLNELYDRKTILSDLRESIKNCHESGIFVEAFILVGLPQETEKDFQETIEFCKSLENYVDHWIVSKFFLSNKSLMFKNPDRFNLKIGQPIKIFDYEDSDFNLRFSSCMIDMGFHGKKYTYTINDKISYEKHLEIIDQRYKIFNKIFNKNKKFSYGGYDFLKSINKIEELARFTDKLKPINIGLASNQNNIVRENNLMDENFKFISEKYFNFILNRSLKLDTFEKILLTGGEPLIHTKIIKFLKILKHKNITPVIKTNARMLSNIDFCKNIRKYCNEILVIDHSSNEQEYENLSKVKGSWKQSRVGLNNWESLGGKITYFKPD